MIVAVIVTYNRKEVLVQNIDMLFAHTHMVNRIIVGDNCSIDATYEYLIGYKLVRSTDRLLC